jgi:tetratricopeptide (TPR) repeat protein
VMVDLAGALSTMGITRLSSGDLEGAQANIEEAVSLFRQCGDRYGEGITKLQLGEVEIQRGQAAAARTHLLEALAIAREIGHPETECEAERLLGEIEVQAGQVSKAARRLQQSLALCVAGGDRRGEAQAVRALGRLDLSAGRLDAAQSRLRAALVAFDGFQMRGPWVACLEDHAALALAQGDPASGCALAAAVQRIRDNGHLARSPDELKRWQEVLARLRSALGAEAFDSLWAVAREWDAGEVQRRALGRYPAAVES